MEIHQPDFTVSELPIGGMKFPTGDSSRIKEEFQKSMFRVRHLAESTDTTSILAPAPTTRLWADNFPVL